MAGLFFFTAVQVGYHYFFHVSSVTQYQHLQQPSGAKLYKSAAQGSSQLVSYLLMLGVQMHDNQKGRHLSYRQLNYDLLSEWLLTINTLNPSSDYAAFMAARVYSQVPDKHKIRQMIDVVSTLFKQNPARHWRRMTEATLLAKHQLQDSALALKLAKKIATLPPSVVMPHWARDMRLVLLDELGELESAQLLISSMLQSKQVQDADEIRFLQSRLLIIQQKMLKNEQNELETR